MLLHHSLVVRHTDSSVARPDSLAKPKAALGVSPGHRLRDAYRRAYPFKYVLGETILRDYSWKIISASSGAGGVPYLY